MQSISAGPFEIALEERGQGPALLWLHGGFVSHRAWAPQRDLFDTAPFHNIYIDLPGHGASTRAPQLYAVERFAASIWSLLDQMDVPRAALIGHSLGGMIAQTMTLQAPHRVTALALADTTYSTRSTLLEQAQTLLAQGSFRVLGVERIARASARQLSKYREDLKGFIYSEMMTHADDLDAFHAMWRAVFAFDSQSWLHALHDIPTLLLVAEQNHATQRQVAGFMRALPNAQVEVIPRAGHMLGWDNPEAFNAALLRFLTRHLSA